MDMEMSGTFFSVFDTYLSRFEIPDLRFQGGPGGSGGGCLIQTHSTDNKRIYSKQRNAFVESRIYFSLTCIILGWEGSVRFRKFLNFK